MSPAWRRSVYDAAGLPAGRVEPDAYVVCVLEQLHRPLGRWDVFARPSAPLVRPAGAAAIR